MGKFTSFLIGTVIGAAGATVWNYLFAPANGTTLDAQYQSRLDWALAEGERAGIRREAELRAELAAATAGQKPAQEIASAHDTESPDMESTDALPHSA